MLNFRKQSNACPVNVSLSQYLDEWDADMAFDDAVETHLSELMAKGAEFDPNSEKHVVEAFTDEEGIVIEWIFKDIAKAFHEGKDITEMVKSFVFERTKQKALERAKEYATSDLNPEY